MTPLIDSHNTRIDYVGPDLASGPLPGFIYFALSGEESLHLPPYNHPVLALQNSPLRIFSFTLPGHGPGFNKFHALQYWRDRMDQGEDVLGIFFNEVLQGIEWLVANDILDPSYLAVGGLSRGGFIASHIAARESRVSLVLGFAPLTTLESLKEFNEPSLELKKSIDVFDLKNQTANLLHVKNFRFYIGNRDTRVGTDTCFSFIHKFANDAHAARIRHQQIELRVSASIGQSGHGTHPDIFKEGGEWVKTHLIGS